MYNTIIVIHVKLYNYNVIHVYVKVNMNHAGHLLAAGQLGRQFGVGLLRELSPLGHLAPSEIKTIA